MRGDLFLSQSISAGTSKSKSLRWQLLHDRVPAVFLPAAVPASESRPYRVEVVHCRSDERRVVREEARLEVARARSDDCHDRWQHGLHTPGQSQSHTACLFERLKDTVSISCAFHGREQCSQMRTNFGLSELTGGGQCKDM